MVERTGGYISKICFNNDMELNIQENSVVVFVGPNNVGKSQALRDIYSGSKENIPGRVVGSVEITKSSKPISGLLKAISPEESHGDWARYNVLGKQITLYSNTNSTFPTEPLYGGYRDLFVANLDTSARLTICNAPNSINRDAPKTHPIHYAAFDSGRRKWLSENFKKAFGVEVTPNISYGATIPLCIGKPVKLEGEFDDDQSRFEAYAEVLKNYEQVQNQGDGVKSFTGILLYLMLDHIRTFLIDEPESFLHPPQSRIMGQIIGETLSDDQQIFLSTHSEEMIKGLIETCSDRMIIVRITRDDNTNYFSVLDGEKIEGIWRDPLLRYSNIISSLFHKSVVLCESDSDCRMYSVIDNHLKQLEGLYSEALFIQCGGKQRMAKIVSALRALDVNVRLIVDIDVLDNNSTFRAIVEAFDVDWDIVKSDYKRIVSSLHQQNHNISRKAMQAAYDDILNSSSDEYLTKEEVKSLSEILSVPSKWKAIKNGGVSALPRGDASAAYSRINTLLKEKGIHIVPVGELECFVKEVGGHGPEWVNKVLETYPDIENNVYKAINDFINSLNL